MTFSDFLKIFKGNIVSVSDERANYTYKDESVISDREVEQITNDENGVHVKLKTEIMIPLVDILKIYNGESVAIKLDNEWMYMKVNEAMKDHKDCAVLKMVNMNNVLKLVLKRDVYRTYDSTEVK